MAEVKILVKGYVSGNNNNKSCPTITLIKDVDNEGKKVNMVVDPGILKDRKLLVDALKKEKLNLKDINWVCITHSHMDHYRNIGMFPDAKALDYWGVWNKDELFEACPKFSKDIEILKTPGHNYDGITLLVRTVQGIVAVVGDVFWKEGYPEPDPYASDSERLKSSRELVQRKADFIVPGHGDIYKTDRRIKQTEDK